MANLLITNCCPVFTEGLSHLFQNEGHLIAALPSSSDETIARIDAILPDVVILDTRLPPNGPYKVLEHMAKNAIAVPTMLIAHNTGKDEIEKFRKLNVSCIVGNNCETQTYVECLHNIILNEKCCSPNPAPPPKVYDQRLSKREIEIAEMVMEGKRNEEIARLANVKVGTVKVHLARIYKKLDISSRVELILLLQKA